MKKRYCLDTSGLSNPQYTVPPDIFVSLWQRLEGVIASGVIAVTREIYDELVLTPESILRIVKTNKNSILMEVNDDSWSWLCYVENFNSLSVTYRDFISEYNRSRKNTVGINEYDNHNACQDSPNSPDQHGNRSCNVANSQKNP